MFLQHVSRIKQSYLILLSSLSLNALVLYQLKWLINRNYQSSYYRLTLFSQNLSTAQCKIHHASNWKLQKTLTSLTSLVCWASRLAAAASASSPSLTPARRVSGTYYQTPKAPRRASNRWTWCPRGKESRSHRRCQTFSGMQFRPRWFGRWWCSLAVDRLLFLDRRRLTEHPWNGRKLFDWFRGGAAVMSLEDSCHRIRQHGGRKEMLRVIE